MSKKRSRAKRRMYNRTAVDQSAYSTQSAQKDIILPPGLFANDGFTNQMAYIGEASELMKAGTYERRYISSNIELLTVMYRQNWICKRIIDVPSEDMTRSWYSLNSQLDVSKEKELHRLQQHHDIKGQLTNAIRWARLYGGAAALIVISGQEDMLEEPLDLELLQPDCFRGLIVIDRWMGLNPSIQIEQDMDDVDFGYPKYYDIYLDDMHTSYTRVHHSRLITFRGRDLPHTEQVAENYWGTSEMEHIYEELQKRNTTSANIAQLVFQANVRTLKMSDFGQILAMGTTNQKRKILDSIQQQNRLVSNFGLQVLSAQDSFENHPYSFGGLADIYEKFMSDMAGAAEIPATKLYGRSPQGMNSTGQSDMNMYYENIAQKQEKYLRPALERLIPVMCMSMWGAIPDDYEIVFNPIATVSASDKASIGSQITKNVIDAFGAGLIGRKTALLELRQNGAQIGIWSKITDQIIDEADDSVDQGGGEQGGMPGAEGMQGGMPPDMAQGMPPEAQQGMPPEAQQAAQMPPDGSTMPQNAPPAQQQTNPITAQGSGLKGNIDPSTLNKAAALIIELYGEKNQNPMDKDTLQKVVKLILQEYGKGAQIPDDPTPGLMQEATGKAASEYAGTPIFKELTPPPGQEKVPQANKLISNNPAYGMAEESVLPATQVKPVAEATAESVEPTVSIHESTLNANPTQIVAYPPYTIETPEKIDAFSEYDKEPQGASMVNNEDYQPVTPTQKPAVQTRTVEPVNTRQYKQTNQMQTDGSSAGRRSLFDILHLRRH